MQMIGADRKRNVSSVASGRWVVRVVAEQSSAKGVLLVLDQVPAEMLGVEQDPPLDLTQGGVRLGRDRPGDLERVRHDLVEGTTSATTPAVRASRASITRPVSTSSRASGSGRAARAAA